MKDTNIYAHCPITHEEGQPLCNLKDKMIVFDLNIHCTVYLSGM